MSHLPFHNDTVSLNQLWYESQKNMIATVCIKLGQHDKIEELTGYLYFCQDARPKIHKHLSKNNKNPQLGDVDKVMGKEWKALSDNKRKVYDEKSKKDKERYGEEMEEYNATH